MKIFLKKIIVFTSILSFTFLPVLQAEAFIFHDPVHTVVTSAFSALSTASTAITNFSVGLPGTGSAAAGSFLAGKTVCKTLKTAVTTSDLADITNIATAVVGEGYSKVTKLTIKYSALKALRICMESLALAVDSSDPAVALAGNQAIASIGFNKVTLAQDITDVSRKMDDVKTQLNKAWEEVWKAITVRLLMQAQQKITTNLVNNLVQKYKISNYTEYANAVASRVYNPKYISEKFRGGKDQMIVKALISGGLGKKTAMPMIKMKADQSFGQKADNLNLYDPNFFTEMALKGKMSSNPSVQEYFAESGAAEVTAKAQAKASEEIGANNGFKSSWDCKAPQDERVDSELLALSQDVSVKNSALEYLQSEYDNNPESVDYSQIELAQQELETAQSKLEEFSNKEKDPAQECELLNPGSTISSSMNNFLSSHLNSTANMKESNLPFFSKFLESTASNFLTNIIGKSGKTASGAGISETGVSKVAVTAAETIPVNKETDSLKESFTSAQQDNIIFEGVKTAAAANEYKLQWDAENYVGGENLADSFVEVSGPLGLYKKFNDLKGSMIIGNPNGGTYTLKVNVFGQYVSVKTWVMPKGEATSFTAPDSPTVEDAVDAAQGASDETDAILPDDTWVDPSPNTINISGGSVNVSGTISGTGTGTGTGTTYIQLCNSAYAGNQTLLDECIAARGIGYVLGSSIINRFTLRDASGVALRFFFNK